MAEVSLNGQLPGNTADQDFENSIGLGQLGNPIFDDITFPAGNYITLEGVLVEYQALSLQTVRFTVNQAKNIVRTPISGRNGFVKEYNNTGDFIIRCQTNLSNLTPTFPREQLESFVQIAAVPQQIPIVSKILNVFFDIDNVILSEFSVDPGNGSGNVTVNFVLESDEIFDLSQFIVSES